MKPLYKQLFMLFAPIAIVNFIAFLVISSSLGGSALNGKIEQGRYYLGDHGRYTEVSHSTFIFSGIHSLSAVASVFAFIAGVAFFLSRKPKKKQEE